MSNSGLNMSRRIRRTPYTDRVEAHGVTGFSVVNHMLLPKAFGRSVAEDFVHLRETCRSGTCPASGRSRSPARMPPASSNG